MTTIQSVHAREVLDSRGNPTVEVEVLVSDGSRGRAIAPSGASTGRHECLELRDADMGRFRGKGVLRATQNVREAIGPAIVGKDVTQQRHIDETLLELDGTANLSRLGANAVLATSLAVAHAAAAVQRVPLYRSLGSEDTLSLPVPMVNMISGGLHAGRQVDFQDYLILPIGASSYSQALQWIVDVYRYLGDELRRQGHEAALVGDEGGYGPKLQNNRQALDLILQAVEAAGRIPGEEIAIGIDVASSHFYRDGRYWLRLSTDEAVDLDADAMVAMLCEWVDVYPLVSIEDGLAEDDWEGWQKLTAALGDRVQLIGDDLLVTNANRVRQAIDTKAANAVLVKPNQIGTLTQTLDVVALAKQHDFLTVISARSGETEDSTIADLAVGTAAGQIKIGSITRSERLAKYNQLLRIEEELGDAARYAGPELAKRLARQR